MNTTAILKGLLIAALLVSTAVRAADTAIQVDRDQGTPVAQFKIGESRCVLKDDKIRCAPVRN
jgi:hypothetical protein